MERATHKIDATGKIAGRLASEISVLLQGKNKASYQPNTDAGDFVEVANVGEMKFSGKKLETKEYFRNTGYPGGIRSKKVSDMMETEPQEVLKTMVFGMLPKNKLRSSMIKRLKFN